MQFAFACMRIVGRLRFVRTMTLFARCGSLSAIATRMSVEGSGADGGGEALFSIREPEDVRLGAAPVARLGVRLCPTWPSH